jgi:hypothetical protein
MSSTNSNRKDMSTSAAIEVRLARQCNTRNALTTERVQGEFAVTDPMKSTALRALRKAARERPTHSTAQ